MAPDRLHVLFFPVPIQSHINPMLHFASHLASRGCSVTFLHTQQCHKYILKSHRPSHRRQIQLDLDIRFVAIPDGLPPSSHVAFSWETLVQILNDMQKYEGLLEELIESSRTGNSPISCIISNCFCPWVQDLAKKAGLPGAMYLPGSATWWHLSNLTMQLNDNDLERGHLDLGRLHIHSPQMLSGFFSEHRHGKSNPLWTAVCETAAKASHILVNSFEALEDFLDATGPQASKMRFIGPCLPVELLDSGLANDDKSVKETLSREDAECLTWLDSHAACSVLFISFGSIASLSSEQIEQIAMGIEESKLKFLWVIRPDNATGKSPVPEGFIERTRDQGRIIPWAQQLQVLQHAATGGFMTHCGWNSTLESMFMGVPMLCLPLFADQPINGYLIVKHWRVGMALEKDGEGKARKEEVARAARSLMEGDEGQALRKRAGLLKEASRLSLREGGSSFQAFGSSFQALNCFLEDITNPKLRLLGI